MIEREERSLAKNSTYDEQKGRAAVEAEVSSTGRTWS
jgi:hypothetical protein